MFYTDNDIEKIVCAAFYIYIFNLIAHFLFIFLMYDNGYFVICEVKW